MPAPAIVQAPTHLAPLLEEFARTKPARACAHPAGAYANCLAVSSRCAEWLRARGVECGMLLLSGSVEPFPEGSGRWPFCDPREFSHSVVRVGDWSIDWTARQFRPGADWPEVAHVDWLASRWHAVETWACARCAALVAHPRHRELTPSRLERAHRDIARATRGRGPFGDPRHDSPPALALLCACDGAARA